MNALVISFIASAFSALSNLFFRKNTVDSQQGSPSGFLVLFYLIAFLTALFFYPSIWSSPLNFAILAIGGSVGVLNIALMHLTSRALKYGPAGLTFAFQNSGAIFPGFLLFLIFGTSCGYSCSIFQLLGMLCVVGGLFIGARKESSHSAKNSSKWLIYALGCFAVQILALTLIQGRSILFQQDEGPVSFFSANEMDDMWFMPAQFGTAFILQFALFLREKRPFNQAEVIYGCLSGIANFAATCLILFATRLALPFEKSMLFPCFSVGTFLLCNMWAKKLYKEDFNFLANGLCGLGIFMGILLR
ncbi:hypothetical protein [Parachlamydia sp. AcF125]|uniref:hypothetical protein n=1 Tax=Parachlamydia sp. AcF125 TaxID=2795736 RepID=UPI001BCA1C12|nr:hypothetical protein [Parachlamydia sp. AcF125]MBS4168464.1 hypothetical protein [Parachlamydia sp. AcF125]